MQFAKRLRDGVQRGEITCSVRIWMQPRVTRGKRYRMGEGEIEVDSVEPIALAEITPQLARESGFAGVVDLLKTAKHGAGTNVYLIRFHYVPAARPPGGQARSRTAAVKQRPKKPSPERSSERQRKRIVGIIERLPGASAVAQRLHLSLEVGKKRFGYFLDDHHGDGHVAINCKASADLRDMLQQRVPSQFHIPKYLGNRGWVGLWLDGAKVDWQAVELALREAYLLVAPGKPAARGAARRS